jgi:peptide/nickel transport system substrate-binding protein
MKWSDGAPFTADDVMFWYEDMYLNEELYPNPLANKAWSPGGKPVEVEKLHDYTVKFTFAQTHPVMLYAFQAGPPVFHYFYWPKHYLSPFHPNHTPRAEVEAMAKEAGYDNWVLFFKSKVPSRPYNFSETYIGIPTLEAYEMTAFGNNVGLFERNPYYWKVDAERNQLPYIDRMQVSHVGSKEVLLLKLANGEIDYVRYNLDMQDFPYLIENQEQGGYTVYKNWVTPFGPLHSYRFNQTTKDSVLREIFRDIRFRRAMSLAINRDEINELLFFGTGTPMQAAVNNPDSRFWRDEYAFSYVEYNPDEANRLLDEMGLKWDENRKWRLRPDGKRLSFVNVWDEARTYLTAATELVTEYWAAVGVEMLQRPMDVATYPTLIRNNDYDVLTFPAENLESQNLVTPRIYVPLHYLNGWGRLWVSWYESGGEKGEEPPAEVKVLYDHLETLLSDPDDAARDAAMHALFKSHAENLWTIGTVGLFPQLAAANKNIANVPDFGLTAQWMSHHDSVAHPETWFFKEGN